MDYEPASVQSELMIAFPAPVAEDVMTPDRASLAPVRTFETLPRRIFLDTCTAQTLRDYGGFIYEGEQLDDADRIHRVTDGVANLEA